MEYEAKERKPIEENILPELDPELNGGSPGHGIPTGSPHKWFPAKLHTSDKHKVRGQFLSL